MRPYLIALPALFALTACDSSLSLYYKQGGSVSRMQSDQTQCEVKALKDAPVANQTRQTAPTYFPGRQVCGPSGCYTSPGYWVPGSYYTVDVNEGLRARVMDQCMGQRGYHPVRLPSCTPATKQGVSAKLTTTLPRLTEQSCAIKYEGGGFQIVSPTTPKG